MKRLATVVLIVVGVTLPICAQRSGSHGGFSGHSSSGFHGGFSSHSAPASHGGFRASAPNRYAGTPRSSGSISQSAARGSQRFGAGNSRGRAPYSGDRNHRRPYRSPYGTGFPYGYPGGLGVYPYGYPGIGYPDTTDSDDSQASSSAAPDESDAQPPSEPYQPPALEPWQPNSVLPHPTPAAGSEEAVTLIFKDGRPPEQIHNYLLTRTTLYIDDSYHRVIPTSQLDLVATAKANQDAGVDFHLPDKASR
jgi:hypothetical protein